eukprot:TRINITY_DN5839_c0_g1_i2.p1 TRINITY_DN5839_c0_g1~~TRINITY_DN5839_c0_g1_i2.p1  ORF type:complete len:325 (-),score=28.38 TRINITY_DN5839_c0_g1_i2:230-1204(-)
MQTSESSEELVEQLDVDDVDHVIPHKSACHSLASFCCQEEHDSWFCCGIRCYNSHDFGTSTGLLRCLISRGGKVWTLVCFLALYCAVGGALFLLLEPDNFENSWFTASYFAVVTVCTIGYGDYVVGSTAGRVVLFFYAHIGIVLAGVTVNSISHGVIHAIKIKQGANSSTTRFWKARIFFDKHPLLLFFLLYLFLLFVGSSILAFTADITPEDIENADPDYPDISNRSAWGWDKAFYFSWMTLTTLGYGDQVQESAVGRIFTCLYGILGFSFLGVIFHRSSKHLNTFLPMLESTSRYAELEKVDVSFQAKKVSCCYAKTGKRRE